MCQEQIGAPGLKLTAILSCSSDICKPRVLQGIALSQSLAPVQAAPCNLAVAAWRNWLTCFSVKLSYISRCLKDCGGAPSAAKASKLVRASLLCQFGKKLRPAVLDLRLKGKTRGTKRQPV